jgi:predicted permease
MARVLAASVAMLLAAWQLPDALTSSAVLLAAAALAVGLVVLTVRLAPAYVFAEAPGRGVALRSRASRTIFLRLRDPDAAGRPRPRAPSF